MIKIKNWDLRKKYDKSIPSTFYLTHNIHAYTAKLIPHIPRCFIEKYTNENDIILDPFCGSGTTNLEAKLLSRNSIGIDINPLAVLISEVKNSSLDINQLKIAINLVKKELKNCPNTTHINFPNIDYWFCRKARNELSRIKYCIENLKESIDENIYKFFLLCFSSIIRKSSYADPHMAKTYKSKRVIKKIKAGWIPTPIQYFNECLNKNFEKIQSLSNQFNRDCCYVRIFHGDAIKTSRMLKESGIEKVDFIITSPPYINAQDYFRSYKLELWWLGLATPERVKILNKNALGTESLSGYKYNILPKSGSELLNLILKKVWKKSRKKAYIIFDYFKKMNQILKEFYEILKNGRYFCLIIGNNTICGVYIPIYKIIIEEAKKNGFKLIEIGIDKIKNRLLPIKRNHKCGFIKEEWIIVFQRRD